MKLLKKHSGLYTDHYELSMAQAYLLKGKKNTPACFDYFFRKAPFNGSYAVFTGLHELLETLQSYRFEKEDLEYIGSIGFKKEFIDYLKNFSFNADIYSASEGEIVFPNEPVLRVQGNIIEAQLIETIVLNILNFESLIATKASRMRQAAGNKILIDFGLRRAQGLGGIQASKAAIIGGFDSSSNVYSAFLFDLISAGTQAHSFIQSFDEQIAAFRAFASVYPEKCTLLVDTYHTLESGVPDAIQVAKEMEQRGEKLYGIRLDSGNLVYLSKKVRQMLNEAGLSYVKIVASNQLDEFVIEDLLEQKAPIDAFGVGTSLVTGRNDAALDGIYKLTMSDHKPRLKLSEERAKIIVPGVKNIFRFMNEEGKFQADGVVSEDEYSIDKIYSVKNPGEYTATKHFKKELLLKKVMDKGKISIPYKMPYELKTFVQQRLKQLEEEYKRFENPSVYTVGISRKLSELRSEMIKNLKHHEGLTTGRYSK